MELSIIIVSFYFWLFMPSHGVVHLRSKNDRGPKAWNGGYKCLRKLHQAFFIDPLTTRAKNIIILHTHNMSSPASEIEGYYLQKLNEMITNNATNRAQLRVISDNYPIDGVKNVAFNAIMMTDFYILVADDYDKFEYNIFNFVTQASSWNPFGKLIILFNNPDYRLGGEEMAEKIFRMFFMRFHASNIVCAFANDIVSYDIYFSNIYRGDNKECGVMRANKVDVCDDGKFQNYNKLKAILQENKVPPNMNNCNVKMCAQISPPFVEEECQHGLEIMLINILKEKMNFGINLFCTKMPRGDILKNGSWSNLLGKMRADECDFLVGSLFPDNDVHNEFSGSVTYFQDSYTWFVPLAPLRAPWKGLLVIFQSETWLVFCFVLILTGFTWLILGSFSSEDCRHKQVIACFLNAWSVFLGISTNDRPNYTPLRIFFVTLALYGLNATTIYTSNLIAVFTEPAYDEQIDSISGILKSGLPWGGQEEYMDWFTNENEEEDQRIIARYNDSVDFLPTISNLKNVKDNKQILLANRLFVMSSKYKDEVFGLTGNIISTPLEIITERGYPLLPMFNKIIHFATDSGIIDKINDDFIYNMTTLKRINAESVESDGEVVLTINHLQGAFAVLGYGLILSIFVFILELFWVQIDSNKIRIKQIFQKKFAQMLPQALRLHKVGQQRRVNQKYKKKNIL